MLMSLMASMTSISPLIGQWPYTPSPLVFSGPSLGNSQYAGQMPCPPAPAYLGGKPTVTGRKL